MNRESSVLSAAVTGGDEQLFRGGKRIQAVRLEKLLLVSVL